MRIVQLFARAFRLRCPNCGVGRMFRSWFRMVDACPNCGLVTTRGEDGYIVGAYMFNIITAELLLAAIGGTIALTTWPDVPWSLLLWIGGLLTIALPLFWYPFSKTLFLAFDLVFRPEPGPTGEPRL